MQTYLKYCLYKLKHMFRIYLSMNHIIIVENVRAFILKKKIYEVYLSMQILYISRKFNDLV